MNFYKRYMGDYGRDTAALSFLEHGAYTVLLDTYYATEKPLPAAEADLVRIAKPMSAPERRALLSITERFFPVGPDGLRHNKRADKEIEKHQAQAATNRRITQEREAKRTVHRTSNEPSKSRNESSTNRSTVGQPNHSQNHKKKDLDLRSLKQGAPPPSKGQLLLKKIRAGQEPDPDAIERNRRIAEALGRGDSALAQRIREGTA